MKSYPEYKQSGVEWIGEIPRHWKMLPFMHCLKRVNAKKKTSIPKMNFQESGKFPIIDQGASFIAGWTDSTDSVISDNLPIVIFGDHTRIFKYVDFPFALGADGTQLLYPNYDILNPRFFYYALLNLKIPDRGYNRHYRYLRKFSVACPTLPIQTQIANFLDRKTQQIDELIRIKERKIELLQEQRTALINHAVTKGLDPHVEMKSSGAEWIGEIPTHWKTQKLKHVAKILPSNVDKHIYTDEIQVRLCNYTDVYYNDYITADTLLGKGSCTESEYLKFALKTGDVIITKDSETPDDIGVPTYVKNDLENVVCGYHLTLIRSFDCHGEYIFRFIQSDRTRRYFELESNGITRFGLGKPSIENLRVPIPSDSEQIEIAYFLEKKTEQIDELVSNEHRKIELLKEYRQSLISEAVTGKIDVRNKV